MPNLGANIVPHSDMANDDGQLGEYTQSSLAELLLASAAEQLLLIGVSVKSILPAFAFYSLIRVSIELTSSAIWLLTPNDPQTRIKRRLSLELHYLGDFKTAARDSHSPEAVRDWESDASDHDRRISAVIRANRITLDQVKKERPVVTNMVREGSQLAVESSGDSNGIGPLAYLQVWRVSSGYAHGRDWARAVFSSRVNLPEQSNPNRVGVTVSLPNLLLMFKRSVDLLEFGVGVFESRNRRNTL